MICGAREPGLSGGQLGESYGQPNPQPDQRRNTNQRGDRKLATTKPAFPSPPSNDHVTLGISVPQRANHAEAEIHQRMTSSVPADDTRRKDARQQPYRPMARIRERRSRDAEGTVGSALAPVLPSLLP